MMAAARPFQRTGVLAFPPDAKEIKARWRIITDAEKSRYHWVDVTLADGSTEPFGLTALHITTKDLPNWFWATFEHRDNAPSEAEGGVPGHVGFVDPSVDRYTCPDNPTGCDRAPDVVQGTKWSNYVLRGTQIDFVTGRGQPTILVNSVIEAPFQDTSSCITCHARAAYETNANFLSIFRPTSPLAGFVGAPDPAWFFSDVAQETVSHMQTDFVWALMRACSTRSSTPTRCR